MRKEKEENKKKYNWSDEDLPSCHDVRYTMSDCCKAFNISKSSLKNHSNGRTKSRKIEAQTILTKQRRVWSLLT